MEEEYVPYVAEPTEQQKQPALIPKEPVQTISDQNQPPSESAVVSDNEANSQSPGISKTSIKPEVTLLTKVEEPALNESEIESNFLRHIIKQRSGNFPELKRQYDSKHEHQSMIYDIISSNENTNRNKKLLQGSEWVSRNKMNNMLYENRVFYNGVEHKLLSRKKSKFNVHDDIGTKKRKLQSDHDDFDLNSIAKAEDILKPISSLKDIVTHPTIKKTFLNEKIFNDLEIQTTLMIEKAKIESETLNDYVSVFLGDDPTAYLEDKIKLPEYDHHINFEKNDLNDKIYLDLDDMLRENGKDIRSEDDEDEVVEEEKAEAHEEDVQMQDGLDQLNDKIRNVEELAEEAKPVEEPVDKKEETSVVNENKEVVEPVNVESKVEEAPVEGNVIPTEEPKEQPVDVEAVVPALVEGEIAVPPAEVEADVQPSADIAVQPVQTEASVEAPVDSAPQPLSEPVAETTTTMSQPAEIEKVDSNDMHDVIEKTEDIIIPSAEPVQPPVAPSTADKPSTHATPPVFNSDDDDDFDPFFGLPEYEKTTLNQRLFNLSEYDPETTQQTAFSRQLTQILLQRNQEFIKNMIAIRQHFFKIERIRERLVKWGYEYSGIPEEDVEVPNVLTAVKRGLISASTNRTSVSGQGKEGYEDSGDDNEEEE